MKISEAEFERYSRQMQLPGWGEAAQLKLKNAKVFVVGAGALGCAVLQNLARTGVGRIGIADDDRIALSNLQRQVLFDDGDAGRLKVECAKEKLERINPFVKSEVFSGRIHAGNVLGIIENFDVIVDGSDNFETKYLLSDACVISGKPLVAASIEGFEGQVSVFNYKEGPTYRCLFPRAPLKDISPDCNSIGVAASLPLIMGNLQANEVIKIITGLGEVLSGKFLLVNLLSNSFSAFTFKPNPENKCVVSLSSPSHRSECAHAEVEPVDAVALKQENGRADYWLLDVRSEAEHQAYNIGGVNIPVYELDGQMENIPGDRRVLAYCNGGISAMQAAMLISRKKNVKVYYLASGLELFKKD